MAVNFYSLLPKLPNSDYSSLNRFTIILVVKPYPIPNNLISFALF